MIDALRANAAAASSGSASPQSSGAQRRITEPSADNPAKLVDQILAEEHDYAALGTESAVV